MEGPVSDDREAEGETEVPEDVEEEGVTKVAITAGGVTLEAEFGDNACARALINQMPFTVPMEDLYGRELCYRYGAGALPTEGLRYDGYELGDICYWPPRGSLVILYAQNGEEFERQQVGRVTSDISVLNGLGDVDVTFSLA